MFEAIPQEMRAYRQWVCWRLEWKKGDVAHELKPTKIPYSVNRTKASVTDPRTWNTFDDVVACGPFTSVEPCDPDAPISETGFTGIGFVFTKDDPFTGIDLDETHDDPEAYARQIKIFREFNSYSELSPSGRGLHIIIKAKLPGKGRRRASIELYDNERYFTVTGNVHHAVEIAERQELAELLYAQMGGPVETFIYGQDQSETQTDEDIIRIASQANNGNKFQTLFAGDWRSLYGPQFGHQGEGNSEADFALVDIVAYYTQNRNQIARIFLSSQLGDRYKSGNTKHNVRKIGYMVEKSFDRQLPPIDIDGLNIAFEKMLAERRAENESGGEGTVSANPSPPANAVADREHKAGVPQVTQPPKQATLFPPGLIGEVAKFIYDASPRPVAEIAIFAAICFVAGITGRAYNVSGTGLNQYGLLVAETGRGKEAIAGGISKLVEAIKGSVPGILEFVGPTEIASPQSILKWLARAPCFFSIVGEFGLKLKEMSAIHANPNTTGLKRTMLDLYNKSGKGNVLGAMAYSKREENTAVVNAPSFTLIGESTPSRFFENVDEAMVQDGLLPRFMVIEYSGPRVAFHKNHKHVTPTFSVVGKLAELTAHCLKFAATNTVHEIAIAPEAEAIFDKFDKWIDGLINDKSIGVVGAELWNRAHIKAMKLAGLFAVGDNYINPTINAGMAQFATDEIYKQTMALKSRFDRGEVGGGSVNAVANETKQMEVMVHTIGKWASEAWTEHLARRWRITEEMHRAKIFPFNSLLMCLNVYPVFRNDRRGGSEAVRKIYLQLLDNDDLREIPKADMQKKFGKSCKAFAVSNAERFIDALQDAA